MIFKSKNWIILFVLVSCCGTKAQEERRKVNHFDRLKEIVLINAPNINRCEMGQLVQSISLCNPKVIGLNFLFVNEKEHECDSILRQSIITSDKIILVEGFENGSHIESHKVFSEVAFSAGLTGLSQSADGFTDSFYKLIDFRGKWELSFPFHLALKYDKNRAAELSSKLTPQDYPIIFYHDTDDFAVLNYNDDIPGNCHLLYDKIVIVGSLGPEEVNMFSTRVTENSLGKTYGTVIIANVILDILTDLDQR